MADETTNTMELAAKPQADKIIQIPAEPSFPATTGLGRMAFSIEETAQILGLHYMTVYRLIQRGKLKCSSALRCKLIARTEIERFLRETQS